MTIIITNPLIVFLIFEEVAVYVCYYAFLSKNKKYPENIFAEQSRSNYGASTQKM